MKAATRTTTKTARPVRGKGKPTRAPAATTGSKKAKVNAVPSKPKKESSVPVMQEREERNGVKRPRAGGKCAAVWVYLDSQVAKGKVPTIREVLEYAPVHGWNKNNVSAEFYAWRKFNRPA
jgi:hypothetical protein